jgi:hypothetical protein
MQHTHKHGWIYTCPECNGAHGELFDVADGSGRFGAQFTRTVAHHCDECAGRDGPELADFDGAEVSYNGVPCNVDYSDGALYLYDTGYGDQVAILTDWEALEPLQVAA